MSKPTTAKEREQHLKDLASLDAEQGGLSTLNRDFTRRLIADVKVLEAERDRLLLDAALDERFR